ncbi:MAG: TIGR02266 family protein [Polyangiaceae bacterium]|jgi:uncharacterized protein (TIGR02266 family)
MTQDTRKDRRVKIVSLNVRYKSATVDEFIENHALDVSRGGIYIKTTNPFAPGTLLKFEVRLASDQAVITGVGRVVWKRDTAQAASDRPAGMGVKFIKVDDASKAVIDRLMSTRSDAGKSFESEPEAGASATGRAGSHPAEVRDSGRPTAAPPPLAPAPSPPPPYPASPPPATRATTSVGLGTAAVAAAGRPSVPAQPVADLAMFPKGYRDSTIPPRQEQTVMRQAAELLEEALREAGGSMDEVGQSALFADPARPSVPVATTPLKTPSEPKARAPSTRPPQEDEAAARARAAALSAAPEAAPRTPAPQVDVRPSTASKPPSSRIPSPAPAAASFGGASFGETDTRRKKNGSATWLWLGAIAAVALVGVTYRDELAAIIRGDAESSASPAVPSSEAPPPASALAGPPSAQLSAEPARHAAAWLGGLAADAAPAPTPQTSAGVAATGAPIVGNAEPKARPAAAFLAPAAPPKPRPQVRPPPAAPLEATATRSSAAVEAPSGLTTGAETPSAPASATAKAPPNAAAAPTVSAATAPAVAAATTAPAAAPTAPPSAAATSTATAAPSATATASAAAKPRASAKAPDGNPY